MRLTYDPSSDMAYLRLSAHGVDNKFTFSEEEFRPVWGINLDLDTEGRLVGIEFENASQLLQPDVLAQAERS